MKTVVLDPGHGGFEDSGAVARDGVQEKHFNLTLALAVRDVLTEEYECGVVMTRETDIDVEPGVDLGAELRARANLANKVGADLFVSLHHDSGSPSARGGSVYIWTDKRDTNNGLVWLPAVGNHKAPRSYQAAERFYGHFKDALAFFGVPVKSAIMCADFGVLRHAKVPAILVECFYGSNAEDVAAARKPAFIPSLARGIAKGIAKAIDLPERARWNPAKEVQRLMDRGVIDTFHDPQESLNWGTFATVVNRILDGRER